MLYPHLNLSYRPLIFAGKMEFFTFVKLFFCGIIKGRLKEEYQGQIEFWRGPNSKIGVSSPNGRPRTTLDVMWTCLSCWDRTGFARFDPKQDAVVMWCEWKIFTAPCFLRKNIGFSLLWCPAPGLLQFFRMHAPAPQYCREWWLSQIPKILPASNLIIQSRSGQWGLKLNQVSILGSIFFCRLSAQWCCAVFSMQARSRESHPNVTISPFLSAASTGNDLRWGPLLPCDSCVLLWEPS